MEGQYIIENNIVKLKVRTVENGKYTGGYTFKTFFPTTDISQESAETQAIVNAARIGYVEPTIEEET